MTGKPPELGEALVPSEGTQRVASVVLGERFCSYKTAYKRNLQHWFSFSNNVKLYSIFFPSNTLIM